MRKIIICTITSLILMLTASYVVFANNTNESVPVTETENLGAVEIIASGTCGDDLTWELNSEGLLAISGTGDMYDWESMLDGPWDKYRLQIYELVIEEGVTSVGSRAFANYNNLERVALPDSINEIEKYAFYSCYKLKTISFPSGLEKIGEYAFGSCESISEVRIPDSVKVVGNSAFSLCYGIEDITIGAGLTTLSREMFWKCTSLKKVTIPDNITAMEEDVFYECESVSTVVIPNSLASTGVRSFYGCTNLTDITIEEGISEIDMQSFEGCANLENIDIPDSVTAIYSGAFSGCKKLKSIDIPDGVTIIGGRVFGDCNTLTSVTIPNSVTAIGGSAFYSCDNLVQVNLSENITKIGECAFMSCDKLEYLRVPDGVTSISNGLFKGCENLKSVELPNSIEVIGAQAFIDCSNLKKIEIPNNVRYIWGSAFQGCTELIEITIPDSVIRIGETVFNGCENLNTVYVGKGLETIESNSFVDAINKNVPEFIVDNDNKFFSSENGILFNKEKTKLIRYPTNSVEKVYRIPNGVIEIDLAAFKYCDNLDEVFMPETVTTIGDYAFSCCTNLVSVTIPSSVIIVYKRVFDQCDKLVEVHYCGTKEQLVALFSDEYDVFLVKADIHYECQYKETTSTNSEKGHTYGLYCPECGWLSGEDIGFLMNVSPEEIDDFEYTGTAIEPEITITQGDRILEEGRDYELTYSNNIDAGTAEVEIKGVGEFSGVVTKNFKIIPKDLTGLVKWELESWDLSWCENLYTDSLEYIENNLTITLGEKRLVADKDYDVWWIGYNSEKEIAGNFYVKFIGNYKGTLDCHSLEIAKVKEIPDQHFTGAELRPKVVVNSGDYIEGVDYRLEYSNNIEMGTATVKILPLGDHYGSTEATFEITDHDYYWKVDNPATLDNDGAKSLCCYDCGLLQENVRIPRVGSIIFEKRDYTGKEQTPPATIKDIDGNVISKENGFVGYPVDGLKVGRYKAIAYFQGDYSGQKNVYFVITPKAPKTASAKLRTVTGGYDDAKFSWSKSTGASGYYVYCKKSTAKEYTYLTRTTATSYTKKNLTDGVKYYFKVVPYYKSGDTRYKSASYKTASVYTLKKISTPKLSRSGSKVKVKWTNINGETGYQISKSTKKSRTNIVSTYKTTKGTYKTIKATKGKRYYYKVRAYKVVDGKRVYGPWSAVKSYRR